MYRLQMLALRTLPWLVLLVGCGSNEPLRIVNLAGTPPEAIDIALNATHEAFAEASIDLDTNGWTLTTRPPDDIRCPTGAVGCTNHERQSISVRWDGDTQALTWLVAHEMMHVAIGDPDHTSPMFVGVVNRAIELTSLAQ